MIILVSDLKMLCVSNTGSLAMVVIMIAEEVPPLC